MGLVAFCSERPSAGHVGATFFNFDLATLKYDRKKTFFSVFGKFKILRICKMYARSKLKKVDPTCPAECLSEQNATSPIKIGQKLRPELAPEGQKRWAGLGF